MPSTDHARLKRINENALGGVPVTAEDSAAVTLAGTTKTHLIPASLSAGSTYTIDPSGMIDGEEVKIIRLAASANVATIDYGGAGTIDLPASGDSSLTLKNVGGSLAPVSAVNVA